jgi:hypothetical protein
VYAIRPDVLVDKSRLRVWEHQRLFRISRAKKIAKAMVEKGFMCPGVITAVEHLDGDCAIIDGKPPSGLASALLALSSS